MNIKAINNTRNLWATIILAALFFILTITVLKQANPGTELPNRDSGFYIYIGKQILKGNLPYQTAWDSKPPAIFYLNAFAIGLGRGLRWGVWLVQFAFLFSAITASYILMKKLWGIAPALFGVFVWVWGMNATLQGGNYTEEYPLVFHFLALILLLYLLQNPKQRLLNLTLGLLFSMSFLFRSNNAIVEMVTIVVFGVTLLWRRDLSAFFTAVIWVTLGIAIPLIITSAYFAYHGLFQAMLEASIFYNFAYSAAKMSATSPLEVGFTYLTFAAWLGLIGYVLVVIRWKETLKGTYAPLFVILLVGAPAAVFLSDLAKRNYGHYFMNWLPFIALLSAYVLKTTIEKFPLKKEQQSFTDAQTNFLPITSLVIACGIFIANGHASVYMKAVDRFFTSADRELRSPIAVYVDNHTNPGEYVLFWATNPGEYFMARRNAPNAALFYPYLVGSEVADQLNEDYLEGIIRNKPVLIVDLGRLSVPSLDPAKREEQKKIGVYPADPQKNLDEVLKFIEENYYLEAVVKEKEVYRLNGSKAP